MSGPTRVDFADAFSGADPKFSLCTDRCGVETTGGGRCFECQRKRDKRGEVVQRCEMVIPEAFRWARFDAPELAARCGGAAVVARAELAVGAPRVVLVGASGQGKTSLAVAMLRAWVRHYGEPAGFAMATDVASARMRQKLGHEAGEVLEALSAQLLVLDDLGTDEPIASSAIREIVFARHAQAKATWITTWMDAAQMTARYGDGMTRRVFEGARIIDCGRKP